MSKLRVVIIVLLLLTFVASFALAAETPLIPSSSQPVVPKSINQGVGANQYGAEVFDSLQGAGLVRLNGTSILNALQVTGSLITTHAEIGSIEVSGEANLTETTIHKGGFVTGSIQAVRSTCEQPLILLTQKAVLTASRFDAITFRKDMAFKGKQILELRQGTIVNGPIVFEGGKGEILLYPGSQVLDKVSGGKIIRKQ